MFINSTIIYKVNIISTLVKVVFSPHWWTSLFTMVNIQSVVYKHGDIFHYDHSGRMIKMIKNEKKKFKQRWWTILSLSTKRKKNKVFWFIFRLKLLSIDIYMSVYTLGVVFFLFSLFKSFKEEFEDTKGVIRIRI